MRVLVLATGTPSQHLVKALQGHEFERHNPDELYLYVSESVNGYDRIYNGNAELATPERLKVRGYDAVISRLGSNLVFGATILQHLNENLGIYCTQSASGLLLAQDKMKTVMRLSAAGIRVPMTVFAQNASHVDFIMSKLGGLPVIAKLLKGSQGVGVMICKDQEQTNTTLESFWGHDIDVMLQRFIDAERKDVRAIVVGDKVVVAMQRTGTKDFRANISQGGSGIKVTLTSEQELMCVQSAKVLGLEFAGVDLMTDKEGKSYIIEVNGNPGTKIIEITGHNYFVDLVQHVEAKVKKAASIAAGQVTKEEIMEESENEANTHLSGSSFSASQDHERLKQKKADGTLSYNDHALLGYYDRNGSSML
jgi:ribosomal protein S6--L-glutamate ligase